MEFKGTLGPWHVSNEGRLLVRDDEWLGIIADSIGYYGEDEELANARLIAAAPDLLEALIELRKLVAYHDQADAAINKALGRE